MMRSGEEKIVARRLLQVLSGIHSRLQQAAHRGVSCRV
jgi:hypothetical protein